MYCTDKTEYGRLQEYTVVVLYLILNVGCGYSCLTKSTVQLPYDCMQYHLPIPVDSVYRTSYRQEVYGESYTPGRRDEMIAVEYSS